MKPITELRKAIFILIAQIGFWVLPEGEFKTQAWKYFTKNFEKI